MCDTEVYTVRVDSVNTTVSNVNFTSYINIPLRNVVKAELISAVIPANVNASTVLYIYVEELVSKFNDRATLQYTLGAAGTVSTQGGLSSPISNLQYLKTAFVAIPADQTNSRTVFTSSGSGFPTDVVYIDPIRQLKTLTVSIYDNTGSLISDPITLGSTFLTFRFTCAKPNVCLYPDRGGVPLL
jgi:hypothetical protein